MQKWVEEGQTCYVPCWKAWNLSFFGYFVTLLQIIMHNLGLTNYVISFNTYDGHSSCAFSFWEVPRELLVAWKNLVGHYQSWHVQTSVCQTFFPTCVCIWTQYRSRLWKCKVDYQLGFIGDGKSRALWVTRDKWKRTNDTFEWGWPAC